MAINTCQPPLPLGISIGEPAGIGPELILKAWSARRQFQLPNFIAIGSASYFQKLADDLNLNIPVKSCEISETNDVFDEFLPVFSIEEQVSAEPGKASSKDASLITDAIETAVDLALADKISAVVTAPINKKALYESGFEFPGHTEFLQSLALKKTGNQYKAVMMLAGPQLRTIPVTIHIALKDVPDALKSEDIVRIATIAASDLKTYFGIDDPRIAISGLNPHAGEENSMGLEDSQIVLPAVNTIRESRINGFGPLPADTMFHPKARETYDVAVCMYHDQALIPAKTLGFDEAVNVTLGLPFIRTSPDHGTAYDIAGKGIADPSSLISAIKMAGEMAQNKLRSQKALAT